MNLALTQVILFGALTSFFVLAVGSRLCRQRRWLTRGTELHHTHSETIPRIGGFALLVALISSQVAIHLAVLPDSFLNSSHVTLLLGSAAMFLVGFLDDYKPIGARFKLVAQVIICFAACVGGASIEVTKIPFTNIEVSLGWVGFLLTVGWLVALTNLINLIDGLDGLAGGIGLMVMVFLCSSGYDFMNRVFAAAMVGAILGFLWFNFPPAKVYLGDGGAYFLGFLIGGLAVNSSQKGQVFTSLVPPLIVLALPIIDMVLAILRRGFRGLPLFRADTRHLHHRFLALGVNRRVLILYIYGFSLFCLSLALIAYWSNLNLLPFLVGTLSLVLLGFAGNLGFLRDWVRFIKVHGSGSSLRFHVRHALALNKWLRSEVARSQSFDDFWKSFLFAAQNVGFDSVVLNGNGLEYACKLRAGELIQNTFKFEKNGIQLVLGFTRKNFLGSSTQSARFLISLEAQNTTAEVLADALLNAVQQYKNREVERRQKSQLASKYSWIPRLSFLRNLLSL